MAGVLFNLDPSSFADVTLALLFGGLAGALIDFMAAARAASLNGASDFLVGFVVLDRAALGGFPSEDLLMAGPLSEREKGSIGTDGVYRKF